MQTFWTRNLGFPENKGGECVGEFPPTQAAVMTSRGSCMWPTGKMESAQVDSAVELKHGLQNEKESTSPYLCFLSFFFKSSLFCLSHRIKELFHILIRKTKKWRWCSVKRKSCRNVGSVVPCPLPWYHHNVGNGVELTFLGYCIIPLAFLNSRHKKKAFL